MLLIIRDIRTVCAFYLAKGEDRSTNVLFRNCSLQVRFLTADVLVLRGVNINWSRRRDAEHKSAKHMQGFPQKGKTAAGRSSEIKWLNAFS